MNSHFCDLLFFLLLWSHFLLFCALPILVRVEIKLDLFMVFNHFVFPLFHMLV